MLGKMDEYLVHQTVAPLAQVDSADPHWQDRFYFNLHDDRGDLLVITGMGAFPNRGGMEGYIFAVHRGHHYTHFVSRALAADREEMTAGGLSFSIVEPMRRWRLQLAPADCPVGGQLLFEARCPAYEFGTIRWDRDGHTVVHQCHYTQSGRYVGALRVGEEVREGLIGMRDRSWGIRNIAAVDMWVWISAQMRDGCLTAWQWETAAGERIYCDGALVGEDGQIRRLVGLEHEVEMRPGERRPRRARLRFHLEGGEELETLAEEKASVYLGRQPLSWSEDDDQARAQADAAALGYDQLCSFRGDLEGWGVVEFGLVGGYRRYGIPPARLG
ncbi:MAG: hypothetical protein NZ695_07460 [Dehalococcoidia bacterium]|jgi:hypothetical protein|nr:hypothetical protein [Dehalococcoidia bacterium]MDW8009293.1 hypothetical protein [Chloroflexota bacterium]